MVDDICPNCHLGHLKQVHTVLVLFYEGTLIHTPDAPAKKCDVCGETIFDTAVFRRLDVLIGDSGLPPNRHVTGPRDTPPAEPDSHLRPPPE